MESFSLTDEIEEQTGFLGSVTWEISPENDKNRPPTVLEGGVKSGRNHK